MKTTILIGAACALIGGASVAGAQTSHILGRDGAQVKLDVMCHRAVVAPVTSVDEGLNITAQQVKCLIRRPDPFARCVRKLGPAPAVSIWNKDDWKGVDKLQQYVANVANCSNAHL